MTEQTRTVAAWVALFEDHIAELVMSDDLHEAQKEHIAERVMQQLVAVTRPRRADLD
jgi:hypothetical protein